MAEQLSNEERTRLRADFEKKYPKQVEAERGQLAAQVVLARQDDEQPAEQPAEQTAEQTADSEPTRDELYEEASRLQIEGRSKMDKDQLAAAVAEAKASEEE